ncbi:MAG: 30S ribosomal protein S3 [Candidatus Methanomethylophilaceae archaeon]|nr:30S ribosomal protein S3 [Candidatus Methanomethylophilaceae archaeon]
MRRVLLKEYLMKEVSRAGFGGLDVQRTPMGTSIILTTERPGLVIGKKGQTIKNLTIAVEDKFGFENPKIEVLEVADPNLNAQIMAEKLAFSLERGWHFRRAGHSTVRRIMDSGAKGCHIMLAGKLTGQRHRREKFKEGYIKFCGEPKLQFMERGYATAKLKMGIIGVTVDIMDSNSRLPDEIKVLTKTEVSQVYPELLDETPAPIVDKNLLEEKPAVVEPKVEEPKVEKPKAAKAKTDKPKVEEPKVEKPKEDKPKAAKPKAEKPKSDEPKEDKPKAAKTKAEKPKAEEKKEEI